MNPALFDWLGLLASVRLARRLSGKPTRKMQSNSAEANRSLRVVITRENPTELQSVGRSVNHDIGEKPNADSQ